jgi:Zn-dependent peptidase ImmA (M78 family)
MNTAAPSIEHISFTLYKAELPQTIHGACAIDGAGQISVMINSRDSQERQEEAFLHEMLHLFRGDHKQVEMHSSEIEEKCHSFFITARPDVK